MVSILKMHRPFPTFAEARTHLLLEELEIDARPPSPPAALVTTLQQPAASGPPHSPTRHARGTRWLHNVPLGRPVATAGSAPTVVAVVVAAAAGSNLLAVLRRPVPRVTHHQGRTLPSVSPGLAPCRCGHMAAHHRHSRPSPPFLSMAAHLAAFPVDMAILHHPRMATGELRPQHRRSRGTRGTQRTIKCLRRRPGTPLMAVHGTRTRWCSPSTRCRSPRHHHPNGMLTQVLALT